MRAVARLGDGRVALYGGDPYTASRIDSFLDASLLFARDTQIYILALRAGSVNPDIHASASKAFMTYMTGIERALCSGSGFIVGGSMSLADICFVAEAALFHNERVHRKLLDQMGLIPILSDNTTADYPMTLAHFSRLRAHAAFVPDIEPYLQSLPIS